MSMDQDLSGYGNVGFDRRLPRCPIGTERVRLVYAQYHQGLNGNGILVAVTYPGRENEGPKGFRIQLGGKFPKYGKRDSKELVAAILGYPTTDPRAMAIEGEVATVIKSFPQGGKPEDSPYFGREFMLTVSESGRTDDNGRPYLDHRPAAIDASSPPARAAAPAETPAPPPSEDAPPPPPAETKAPAADPDGPWFDFKAPDPRAGRKVYNRTGKIKDKT